MNEGLGRAAILVLLLLAAACDRRSPSGAAPRASATTPVEDAKTTARALALSEPRGPSPADAEIERARTSAQRSPQKVDFWILLGQAWIRKARESADPGYYLNANACADLALDLEPQSRLALDLRALVLLNQHEFGKARDLVTEILRKTPDDVMALGTLSDALLELGRFEESANTAQKMVDLKPNLPSYSRASHIAWLRGQNDEAKKIIRLAIDARDPRDPEPGAWVTVQAAMIFWHEGDYEGADAGFDKALEMVRDYPPALVGKGRVAMARGDAAKAAAHFERAHSSSPLVETAWLLGDAREAKGDHEGAQKAYALVEKHGKRADPRTLALFYATKNKEHDEALRLALEEKKSRDDIYTEDVIALALYRKGSFAEARAAIDAALSLGTPDARLWAHAGLIRIATGDEAAGRKLLRDALKLNPSFDARIAAEAKRLLGGE